MLTVQLSREQVDQIFEMTAAAYALEATVNLEDQIVSFGDIEFQFEVEPAVKEKLLQGLDDIAESLLYEGEISTFEITHNAQLLSA